MTITMIHYLGDFHIYSKSQIPVSGFQVPASPAKTPTAGAEFGFGPLNASYRTFQQT